MKIFIQEKWIEMKHYDAISRIQDDGFLMGDDVWAFNKLDGQNLCIKYSPRRKEFGPFGSRNRVFDENDEQFGEAVRFFLSSNYQDVLRNLVKENSGKGGIFAGVDEVTFFFEWYGENSFAGVHKEGDEMHLALIDIFLKKKGYIEPKSYYDIFCKNTNIETPELIFKGKLTQDFVNEIRNYDVEGNLSGKSPSQQIKEGVVCRRSSMLKGQRMPKVKFKTQWWLDKLHSKYSEEECKILE